MEQAKPTMAECLDTIKKMHEGPKAVMPQVVTKQNARFLYLLTRLSFSEDIPILIDLINYEKSASKNPTASLEIFLWLLGEKGEFPVGSPEDGKFYWRTELRKKLKDAGIIKDQRRAGRPPKKQSNEK